MRPHARPPARGAHAFTLIEVLIAVGLMALLGLTTIGAVIASGRISAGNARLAQALAFAEAWQERLLDAPHRCVVPGGVLPGGWTIPATSEPQPIPPDFGLGDDATWRLEIEERDPWQRLVTLTIEWGDPVGGRRIRRVFRQLHFSEAVVAYPGRPAAAG